MQMSRRARRMDRHHARSKREASLNMVSLMDIFTILVFFLLVHSTDVENLPSTKSIKLPESVAEKSPKQTVVVAISSADILVQGRRVAGVADVLSADGDIIDSLRNELEQEAAKRPITTEAASQQRAITILADKEIPYRLLKKIMVTCARASYENISLAVLKRDT